MKTLATNNSNETRNAANMAASNNPQNAAQKIDDFGQKIGGARKDLYAAAHEWAEKLADVTAEKLAAVGLSKLVRLPNLEKMTEAGAITAQQARAALVIWRTIERKPQGSYSAERWAERTREKLEAVAAIITAEDIAAAISDEISKAPEYRVLTAAEWPAVAFSFGKYSVIPVRYSNAPKLQIRDARYYRGNASEDPADIAAQLREMVKSDEEKAADRRAAGPRLSLYTNRAGQYFITPEGRAEIVLQTYETREEAVKAYREDRAALVERYEALKSFPACRREWNRPRVGEDWRKGENMTPEQFAALLPFRGVEFGNWVNQTERAALLNSAFDGFHDLAAVLNIPAAAVCLGGSLAFAFASRGHSGAAAHYEPARRVINLTKKSGAGCMAHEWFHAVDNFAAGGGVHNYATERRDHPKAFSILEAIKKTAYYKRSKNLAMYKGDYWTEGRELTARAFEGVCAVMLNAAGICSDFLVNCKSMDEFTAEDVASRSNYYPYPTAQEAAALLPLYVDFLREVFGAELTAPAAALAAADDAAKKAEADRLEAERIAAERLAELKKKQEAERKAAEERAAREAEERRKAEEEERARKEAEKKAAEAKKAAEGVTTKGEGEKPATGDEIADPHAAGLYLEEIAGGVAVVGNPEDSEKTQSRATYRARRAIKAKGCRWNREASRWEATTPEAVAAVREWFGVSEGTAPATAPTLEQGGEITATTEQAPAVVLPEWLKVGAVVRTRGGYMISNRTMRPEWVEGHEMTVKEINAERVELENRDERGVILCLEGIAIDQAAAELEPVSYTTSEKSQPAPVAIAASRDTADTLQEAGEIKSRQKPATWQDKPAAELPEDLPAELLKFYEVNSEATDENPAPVCLFYVQGHGIYEAFGSDAHTLAQEFGAGVITFSTETEYKHGKTFPAPIDYADFKAAELSERVAWLTREGYAVAVFAAPDCLPTYSPAKDTGARRERHYKEVTELGDGITREIESTRNMYDFHYEVMQRYYKDGELLAMFHATGYPGEWEYIGTLRPPFAGRFSNGNAAERFRTIWQAERFMLAEIKAGGLTPYRRREAADTKKAEPLSIEITREERAAVAPSYDTNQDTATLYKSSEITDLPANEYGDLCYDYFGKSSVIVFGNTDDHAAQLEAIGGKYSDRLKYSPLQNGRKWTEKQGRTAGYYFTTEKGKEQAVKYVQRVNHSLFDKYEQEAAKMGDRIQRREDLKEGDRVRTIHGLGTVTAHEPKYNARVSVVVRLDKFTYNYGWQGMPQTFIECRCDEITRYTPSERSEAADEREAAERQERYEARCKELEAEALAQMPYKVGDIVTSRYGETGRVVEMYPEVTGDIDSPHLIYEYDGKPTVNVVILDADEKRHCAHWSVYTLEPAPEIKAIDVLQVGTMVRMPGVIGGLRVEEIDRNGDRVICVDGCKERHTYKGLDYFTATAEEIRIPEWLRICQYFEMDESFGHTRVLCTDIEPCCDALWPVLIRWEDGKDKGGIRLTSALDALNRKSYYYSEYQKLGHQEARPQEWLKKTTNEKRATYYRACVELERMAGDGLPLVIRADGADTEANPWNALEKRVKTARVFHLGDRVKMHYPYQCNEVTGVINRIRFDEGSLSLGGWCTHYDIRFDEEYQRPNNFGGKDTGVGNISPERIELVERAEFCHEPASEWLQPGEKVAHYLDYGDGTGDWLTGNVTGYELCDDGSVIVIYGEYRTALAGMVPYRYEMDHNTPLEPASEIRAYNVGDRVQRIGTGATGTIDDVNNYEGKRTYIVKYDETQRRPSDGFEYLAEEVLAEEINKAA